MESETLTARLHTGELLVAREKAKPVPAPIVLACALAAAWLVVAPRSPDLAAQAYRVALMEHAGFLLWDNNWYAGHHMPGYSLTYPLLAAMLGMRVVGAAAVVASVAIFRRLALTLFGPRSGAGVLWFAVGAAGDLWIGRLSFALGVTFGLAAVLALAGQRSSSGLRWAALWSALCAATSPVAGAFVALSAVVYALSSRKLREPLALALPAMIVVLALQLAFPEGGYEPYGAVSVLSCLAVTAVFVWALPPAERTLRLGGCIYFALNLALLAPTPMGSNIDRFAVLLAAPLLLCALGRQGGLRALHRPRWALALALAGAAWWVAWGPVSQTLRTGGDPSTGAAYYLPVEQFLARHDPGPVRIEVPFTRSHWEAALLAPQVELARGWERQLDKRYDGVLDAGSLDASAYRRWLYGEAVSYVALPDAPLDGSSRDEARVIARHPPFLREVFRSAHWRIYRVIGAPPLARGPGRLTFLGHDRFALAARRPGAFLVRVHYSPWWTVTAGGASVASAGGWTKVIVRRPGRVVVAARLSLHGVLALI